MTTPPLDQMEQEQRKPRRPPEESQAPQLWLFRVLAALIIPALLALFFFTFEFLKDPATNELLQIVIAIVVGVGGVWVLYWAMDRVVYLLPPGVAAAVRPAVFAGPAIILLGFYLVYPSVQTVILSLYNRSGTEFVGLQNYVTSFTQSTYLIALRNSVGWAIVVPILATAVGLAFATLADKLPRKAESISESLIFLPMAVSFVGAAVVFTFVYSFRPEGFGQQIGLLNAIVSALGGDPVSWIQLQPWNNLFLMVILIWTQTGLAMVILAAAIKGVPDDLLEASRIDGANEWQVFWRITVPTIASTIIVVWTTILIVTWKVFDIVWVMTGGQNGTQVVAQQMMEEFFTNRNDGLGAALAVILLALVTPILVINIRRFRAQEAIR